MEIAGYIASVIIGISLGLIGGGGSILTVPVLVYLFGIDPVIATAYSLFIVGTTSLVGAIPKYRHGLVNVRRAVIFGIPSIISVFLTRKFLVPLIPHHIFNAGNFEITKPVLIMVLFAMLMVAASYSMIKNGEKENDGTHHHQFNYPMIILEGTVVGILTGFVGAGGGFLIIPALVLFSKLPMKLAVGTSLVIIAAKSLIGFTGDLFHYNMDWKLLLLVTAAAVLGIFIGNAIHKKMPAERLKKWFGWFVLIMGVYIIVKELFFNQAM
ncbi:MAG TPA: sulfite exporter TauE/SafE family protein [Chitinophagaceae bacterium]|nr:sulfite exporter TauE/SafE family protein [Chitinophagaceae bacterium]